jgi:hypothetical protein
MRIKLIAFATVIAALAIGVATSSAALQNSVQVKLNFKKAGGPGTLEVQLVNLDGNPFPKGKAPSDSAVQGVVLGGGITPQPVHELVISSTSAKYNSKALPYCTIVASNGAKEIPTNAAGNNDSAFLAPKPGAKNDPAVLKNCPLTSLIGKGTFTAVVGTPGQPYNPSQAGAITGNVYLYNYKPRSGDQAAMVAWIQSDNPVPRANQYQYVGVSKSGVIDTVLPTRADIPPNIASVLPDGSISMTSLHLKLEAKQKKKPIFTIKSFSNLNVYGQLIRTDS